MNNMVVSQIKNPLGGERRMKMINMKIEMRNGKFLIHNEEYPVQEYRIFKTRFYNIFLHQSYPRILSAKKGWAKTNITLGCQD